MHIACTITMLSLLIAKYHHIIPLPKVTRANIAQNGMAELLYLCTIFPHFINRNNNITNRYISFQFKSMKLKIGSYKVHDLKKLKASRPSLCSEIDHRTINNSFSELNNVYWNNIPQFSTNSTRSLNEIWSRFYLNHRKATFSERYKRNKDVNQVYSGMKCGELSVPIKEYLNVRLPFNYFYEEALHIRVDTSYDSVKHLGELSGFDIFSFDGLGDFWCALEGKMIIGIQYWRSKHITVNCF